MSQQEVKLLRYNELGIDTLYEILKLRSEIFVVEQECAYQDIDGQDQEALHLLLHDDKDELAAYARIMHDSEGKLHIGRVLVRKSDRKKGMGKNLMDKAMSICKKHYPDEAIIINAQLYLEQFYIDLGFTTIGNPYPWDGILHVDMIYRY